MAGTPITPTPKTSCSSFTGRTSDKENHARFSLPEFDKLYDAAYRLPDSPERTRLFDRMTELVVAYAPWRLMEHQMEDHLLQPWILNYKPHPVQRRCGAASISIRRSVRNKAALFRRGRHYLAS